MTPDSQAPPLAVSLPDEVATHALGAQLARCIRPGMRVYLMGELGAGKTTVVRALLRALGHEGRVKSPTFTLVELYNLSNLCLYHFDFYRIESSAEFEDAGFREHFASGAVCLVEWPERADDLIPAPDLRIRLELAGIGRLAIVEALTPDGQRCVENLRA